MNHSGCCVDKKKRKETKKKRGISIPLGKPLKDSDIFCSQRYLSIYDSVWYVGEVP